MYIRYHFVFICDICVYCCVFMCICVYTSLCTCLWEPEVVLIFFLRHTFYFSFWDQSLSLNRKLTNSARLTGQWAPEICLSFKCQNYRQTLFGLTLYTGAGIQTQSSYCVQAHHWLKSPSSLCVFIFSGQAWLCSLNKPWTHGNPPALGSSLLGLYEFTVIPSPWLF